MHCVSLSYPGYRPLRITFSIRQCCFQASCSVPNLFAAANSYRLDTSNQTSEATPLSLWRVGASDDDPTLPCPSGPHSRVTDPMTWSAEQDIQSSSLPVSFLIVAWSELWSTVRAGRSESSAYSHLFRVVIVWAFEHYFGTTAKSHFSFA